MSRVYSKTPVERCESFSEFKKQLRANNIRTVKAMIHAGLMPYDTGERVVILPTSDWVLTAYHVGKMESKDRIYRYLIRFSSAEQYPDVVDKDDFRNEMEFIQAVRNLENEEFILRGGEYGWPLQERPDEYELYELRGIA